MVVGETDVSGVLDDIEVSLSVVEFKVEEGIDVDSVVDDSSLAGMASDSDPVPSVGSGLV